MLRKIGCLTILFTLLIFLNLRTEVRAEERALVTLDHYEVLDGMVALGDTVKLSLTFKNISSVAAQDVMICAYNPDGDVYPIFGEKNPLYIGELGVGQTFQKDVTISVSDNLIKNNYLQLNFNVSYRDDKAENQNSTAFLSIPVINECRLKMNNISSASDFISLQTGIININYKNTGKKVIDNLTIEINGNIEGKTMKYESDSLGVGIENKIDCYIKFIKAGDQSLVVKAYYTDDDGIEHYLSREKITIPVAEGKASESNSLQNNGMRKDQLMIQGIIILLSFAAILVVLIHKNSRTKLTEREAR